MERLLAFCSVILAVMGQCSGPPQCYDGCGSGTKAVDLVFVIDVSGSMSSEIIGIKSGLTDFAYNLLQANIDAAYGIVLYGKDRYSGHPDLYLDIEADNYADFVGNSGLGNVNGLLGGGTEAAMEALKCVLELTSTCGGYDWPISWRSTAADATRAVILLTDEDSDSAVWAANSAYTSQSSSVRQRVCWIGYTGGSRTYSQSTWDLWQNEIDEVATGFIDSGISLYMLVSADDVDDDPDTCLTWYQFGNPDDQSQSSDLSGFNAANTISLLDQFTEHSLQGQILKAGGFSRVFDVNEANNPDFVANFFESLVADVTQCNDECYDYPCVGIAPNQMCADPINRCDCEGVRDGDAVLDCNGVCNGNAVADCFGVCDGTADYHLCGVCTNTPNAEPSYCDQDCAMQWYIATEPPMSVPWKTDCEDWSDDKLAGYMASLTTAQRNTIMTTVANTVDLTGRQALCDLFKANYFSSTRSTYCDWDATECSSSTAALDYTGANYNAFLTSNAPYDCCETDTTREFPPAAEDPFCSNCVEDTANPPYCEIDCLGVYRDDPADAYKIDDCQQCVPPAQADNFHIDSCGICFGTDDKDQCNVCSNLPEYDPSLDGCNQPTCQMLNCTKDCDDNFASDPADFLFLNDACGNCIDADIVRGGGNAATCLVDCNGNLYDEVCADCAPTPTGPLFEYDDCGVCFTTGVMSPSCLPDCNGVYGGTSFVDACGQCVVNNMPPYECLTDCKGNLYNNTPPYPLYIIDDCSVCRLATGSDDRDQCDVCTNIPNYNMDDCQMDCLGAYYLPGASHAVDDGCECWAFENASFFGTTQDCCGNCPDNTNSSICLTDTQGIACQCGISPSPCGALTTCTDDCPTVCSSGDVDSCGKCSDEFMFNQTDNCGQCCYGNETHNDCGIWLDSCGICFGYDNSRLENECGTCTADECVIDCEGTPNGNKTIACDNTCTENADAVVCVSCGNGVVEANEQCDLAADNGVEGSGCTIDCFTETSNNNGPIIGGVIGAILGLLCLGATAFLAYRYAVKSGLLGNASNTVDMVASNSNPLYDGQQIQKNNPLYETN